MVDPDRLKLYRYVTAPEAGDYLAIMDRFTDALFAEWSAQDVIAQGVDLTVDTVVARCRYLADNGNLLLSPREVRVTTIAEYQSQPARYTVLHSVPGCTERYGLPRRDWGSRGGPPGALGPGRRGVGPARSWRGARVPGWRRLYHLRAVP